MASTIERRLLINYRVDLDVLERFLPTPFRPRVVAGAGVAGICLIRLGGLRPAGLPAAMGMRTENAAHRVAVEWDGPDGPCRGVYIPRRDTSSRLTVMLGDRLFPGVHHLAEFHVLEGRDHYEVAFTSQDRSAHAAVTVSEAPGLPSGSVFSSLAEASDFFEGAPLGYSMSHQTGHHAGLELRCASWLVEPLRVHRAESSFFAREELFPAGTATLDLALLMRDIHATWHERDSLTVWPQADIASASANA
jgi:hypothetical protein